MRPRHRWTSRADILITLAGHAAELRLARLYPRYRSDSPYVGYERDLTIVYKLLAEGHRAGTIFPRFMRALNRVDTMLAEANTWAAIMKVATMLRRFKALDEDDFNFYVEEFGLQSIHARKREEAGPQ
jgi:hypothetical protein